MVTTDADVIAEGWRALKLAGEPPVPRDLARFAFENGIPAEAIDRLATIAPDAVFLYGDGIRVGFKGEGPPIPRIMLTPDGVRLVAAEHRHWTLVDLHAAAGAEPHPLSPILTAYASRPVEVEPETRKDARILPRIVIAESVERERGRLFGGLTDNRRPADLPLFPELSREAHPVPILDLADATGLPVMVSGKGAPLPLRLFVRAMVSVRPADRERESVRLALTLREMRDALFPNGWERRRDWPRLRHALLHARDYTVPSAFRGSVGRWFPLAVRHLPENPSLEDLIVLDVAYPPGAANGPVVDLSEMDQLSVKSSARWRAYIAANLIAWIPGKTQRPVPRAKKRWGWSGDPTDYPILTAEERRALAFGARDNKHRTRSDIDEVWRDLPGLTLIAEQAIDPRSGEVGWRIVPADAAAKIGEGANRGK